MKKYDYLIVGAGLYGAVFSFFAKKAGKKVLVLDKRSHKGGNIYCENIEGINVHKYGAHIFHTNDKEIWDFVNQFAEFNNFINSPMSKSKDKLYNLPFNMNTFYQLWGLETPEQVENKINEQIKESGIVNPSNLEEQAISLVGKDVYETLIKEYTEKQWGMKATELPAFIIKRLPVRFTYDNNYFKDKYQGIPEGGYNKIIDGLLEGIEVKLEVDYLANKKEYNQLADKVVFTGKIDEFFEHKYGLLEYRSLKFKSEVLDVKNHQGNAVINYNDKEVPYTRIIEHKHFEFGKQKKTVITKEYPQDWTPEKEAYYPINNEKNQSMYQKYKEEALNQKDVIFGGRLAEYKYYDMHQVIGSAMKKAKQEFS